ncbi:MAG: flagellin FliC [Betaproteobacteria bacterium HGW-Betaproteobacteria-22]|nr:MAG: flagellin FliC [Betaproteobacteria bacterium HGW-Betaproteobacteria-22]
MASVINTNIASLNTQRNLSASQSSLNTSLQRLSSGLRINSSKDDAAGLAIATRMDSQVRGQQVAIRNANDAISFAQVAEGGLAKQTDALQRMRELAVQSLNGTNTSTDRANLDAEFTQLAAEVTRLATATQFNGLGVFGAVQTFQVGADAGDTITTASVAAATISGNVSDVTTASIALTAIDAALTSANTSRATLGAIQNRFESVVSNLQVSVENQAAAKSRIMDADFAAETANLTRGQILQQAGTAMLAQANSLPNTVLSLLRG